jgi:DNA-binding MarR family transcriptional regulator
MPRPDAAQLTAWEGIRRAVAQAEREIAARLVEERDTDLSTFDVLAALARAGGRMRVHELADALLLGRPTTTRICDRVEAAGLIRRERSSDDLRAVYVVLTKEGRDRYRRCQSAYERFVNDAFARHLDRSDANALDRAAGKVVRSNA